MDAKKLAQTIGRQKPLVSIETDFDDEMPAVRVKHGDRPKPKPLKAESWDDQHGIQKGHRGKR